MESQKLNDCYFFNSALIFSEHIDFLYSSFNIFYNYCIFLNACEFIAFLNIVFSYTKTAKNLLGKK